MNMVDEAKFWSPLVQLLKCWVYDVWLGIVVKKNWPCSVDQCQLQARQFLVHLIDLLSILLRCNGSAEIQKTAVHETCSRTPNSEHDFFFFFLVQVWLWEVLWSFFLVESLSWSTLAVICKPLFIAYHNPIEKWFAAVAYNRENDTSKWWFFWLVLSSWGTHLLSFFTFPICFKCQVIVEGQCWVLQQLYIHCPCVVVRVSASTILSISHCQYQMAGHCTPHFQISSLLCKTAWTTTALSVH